MSAVPEKDIGRIFREEGHRIDAARMIRHCQMQRMRAPFAQRVVAKRGEQQQWTLIRRIECAMGPQPAEAHAEVPAYGTPEQLEHSLVRRLAILEERRLRLQLARDVFGRAHSFAGGGVMRFRTTQVVMLR